MPSEFYNAVESLKNKRDQKLQEEVVTPFLQGLQILEQSRVQEEANTQLLNAYNAQAQQYFGESIYTRCRS